MATDEINNLTDQLDSRDVEQRIKWLKDQRTFFNADKGTIDESDRPSQEEAKEYIKELNALLDLKQQYADYYSENSWGYGAQFIRGSYFKDYAQELAEDCGLIQEGLRWPNTCIDWEQAARELAMDYSEVTFDGVDYYTQEA